jgi:hypothetical protein
MAASGRFCCRPCRWICFGWCAYSYMHLPRPPRLLRSGPDLPPRVIRVTIQRRDDHQKPYLGGYRHKQTEKLYHHASAQTEITPATALAMERKVRAEA